MVQHTVTEGDMHSRFVLKQDGVGPVDNRPFTNYLHHFVHHPHHLTPDTWPVIHFNVKLSSNPGDKVLILVKSRGQVCTKVLSSFLDLVPWIGEQKIIEMLVQHFSNKPDIYFYIGKLLEHHFNACVFSNPVDKI